MSYDLTFQYRRSIRLKGYDYTQPGIYFITLCVQHRLCLFGDIINEKMILNDAGLRISKIWDNLPGKFKSISLEHYILMPNHLHGLIVIKKTGGESIPQIIQYFKSYSSVEYARGVRQFRWEDFPGKLWQRNYYEHIVRDPYSLERIREYIISNLQGWNLNDENPKNNTKIGENYRGRPCICLQDR